MFPCDDCLQLAKNLSITNDEASLRSAVSRAYYASYHKAKIFAQNNGVKFSGGKRSEIHQNVISFLGNRKDENLRLLSCELDRLRNSRNICDYADKVKSVDKMAQNAIVGAEKIFNNIIKSSNS